MSTATVQEQNKAKRRQGEHLMQCTLFDQIRRHECDYPILHCVYAVPNGGFRPINVAKWISAPFGDTELPGAESR